MHTCTKCGTQYDGAEVFCPKDGTRLGGEGGGAKLPSVPPTQDPLIGTVVQGRYKVIRQIGEGGMGVVYIAEHVEIEKKVALKILRDDFSKRPEVVERFRQEARSASKIGHAHIVDVTDFGQLDDGGVYFVMEYLEGQGLSDLIREAAVPLERAVPIIKQIAHALAAAHKMGIVHRDLKPEHVFLVDRDEDGKDFVKILDFGIAKASDRDSEGERLTKTGMIFGTPEYMSPEQAAGKELDHRVDVYALGCIMFEMFSGTVPFDGDSFMAVLTQHMFEPVPPIEQFNPDTEVPPSIRGVVYKALAKDKNDRYEDMAALEADLDRALGDAGYVVALPGTQGSVRMAREGEPTGAVSTTAMDWSPESGTYQTKKSGKTGLIIGLVAGIMVVGGAAAYFLGVFPPRRQLPTVVPAVTNQPLPAPAPVVPKPENGEAAGEEEPAAADEEAPPVELPEKIAVSVETDPAGAVISIEGLGQVCSESPCELELEEGKPVEMLARLGKRQAKMTFTPSEQNKEISLELKKPARRGGRRSKGGGKGSSAGGKDKPGESGGLKIPGIFKDN
jgi:serine/threonine-protein kinase